MAACHGEQVQIVVSEHCDGRVAQSGHEPQHFE